jgi:hypothetical protein
MKRTDEIYNDKNCHKSTITNLFGINKSIEKREEEEAPTQDNECQTHISKGIAHTQTDEGSFGEHHYFAITNPNRT